MLGVRVWRDLKRQEKCDSGNFMISLGGVMPYNGIRAIGHRASWLKSSSAKGPSWGTSLIFLNSNIFFDTSAYLQGTDTALGFSVCGCSPDLRHQISLPLVLKPQLCPPGWTWPTSVHIITELKDCMYSLYLVVGFSVCVMEYLFQPINSYLMFISQTGGCYSP